MCGLRAGPSPELSVDLWLFEMSDLSACKAGVFRLSALGVEFCFGQKAVMSDDLGFRSRNGFRAASLWRVVFDVAERRGQLLSWLKSSGGFDLS